MWWTSRYTAPLRDTYQSDEESSEEFIQLLEQAERRIAS